MAWNSSIGSNMWRQLLDAWIWIYPRKKRPTATAENPNETKLEKWNRYNRMFLMIIKISIPEMIRGSITKWKCQEIPWNRGVILRREFWGEIGHFHNILPYVPFTFIIHCAMVSRNLLALVLSVIETLIISGMNLLIISNWIGPIFFNFASFGFQAVAMRHSLLRDKSKSMHPRTISTDSFINLNSILISIGYC